VAVLGSTGFIGRKALEIADRHPDRITVTALAAGRSVDALAAQAARPGVTRVAAGDDADADALRARLPAGVAMDTGAAAVAALAALPEVDVVLNGIVGRAGLEASLAAASSGKLLALANKESLVLAGELLTETARRSGARILPVDSEHAGLFQCLEGRRPDTVARLILTASGGPFRGRTAASLGTVTPEEALNHPVWPMGRRITVDSATLLNKGLEVIETHWLFGTPWDRIGVWVHPQSVVHALVELTDGSLLAQLSAPDMLLPIQYALSYPERWDAGVPACALPEWGSLDFQEPDHEAFPALRLAIAAGKRGGTAPAVLNAADEVAVQAFLDGRLRFNEIVPLLAEVLDAVPARPASDLDAIRDADRMARDAAASRLEARTP
jgi:1-deoxy-D-xylulose-5-phosphate reductoisomerase